MEILPPCEHFLEAVANWADNFPIEEWAKLLLRYDERGYGERPEPQAPAVAVSHEAQCLVYTERARHKFGLWHPKDVGPKDVDGIKIKGGKGLAQTGLDAYDAERAEPVPLDELSLVEMWMNDGASAADVLARWRREQMVKRTSRNAPVQNGSRRRVKA